jgi:hypothetical protein
VLRDKRNCDHTAQKFVHGVKLLQVKLKRKGGIDELVHIGSVWDLSMISQHLGLPYPNPFILANFSFHPLFLFFTPWFPFMPLNDYFGKSEQIF